MWNFTRRTIALGYFWVALVGGAGCPHDQKAPQLTPDAGVGCHVPVDALVQTDAAPPPAPDAWLGSLARLPDGTLVCEPVPGGAPCEVRP